MLEEQKIKVFENVVLYDLEIIFSLVGNVLERRALFLFLFSKKKMGGVPLDFYIISF
jgi:hypothetical protein